MIDDLPLVPRPTANRRTLKRAAYVSCNIRKALMMGDTRGWGMGWVREGNSRTRQKGRY